MDVVGLSRGRSHAIPPWSDEIVHEVNDRVANEAPAIYILANAWHPSC